MLAHGCHGLRPYFAGSNALVPRVIKLFVAITPTVAEPRTTATATTDFSGFVDGGTFVAYGTDGRCRDCSCLHEGNDQRHKTERKKLKQAHCLVRATMYLMSLASNLHLHAFAPSDQL